MAIFTFDACSDHSVDIESSKPTGSITGIIVDKATSEPLSNVDVTLAYANPDENDEEQYIRTTDESGRFIFKNIPVNGNGGGFSFDLEEDDLDLSLGSSSNYPYSLMLDMSSHEDYRPFMLFDDIKLNFAGAGGIAGTTGIAENLVSSVVIPIGKLNASIKGKVLTSMTNEPIAEARVEAYLDDGYEGFDSADDILIQTGQTDASGRFTLNNLDESSEIYLRIKKDIDEDNRINVKTDTYDLMASAGEENTLLDVGNIIASPVNSGSAFIVTGVSVEDGSLITPENVEFEFQFNKSVKQNPYTSTNHSFGVNSGTVIDDIFLEATDTRAKIGDQYELSLSWNDNFDQLTISVNEELPDGYKFKLDATAALAAFTDEHNAGLYFDMDTPFSGMADAGIVDFVTEGNASTPSVPQLFANFNEEVDYTGVPVELVSVVDETDVDVAYVEIYRKIGDENFTRIEAVDDWFADQIRYNTNTDLLVESRSGGINYDKSIEVSYKVRAVSINLKRSNFSQVITLRDVMGPRILSADYSTIGAPDGKAYIYVQFSEPMRFSSSGGELFNPANYSFRDWNDQTKQIADVSVEVYDFDDYIVRMEIPAGVIDLNSDKILVGSNVVDLAGNGVSQDGTDDEATIE